MPSASHIVRDPLIAPPASGHTASFFADARAAFERAATRAGPHDRDFVVGRRRVRISAAGPALLDPVTGALGHLRQHATGDADLVIRVWDSATTGTSMPSPVWSAEDYTGRGDIRGFNDSRFHTSYRAASGDLSMIDGSNDEALFWLRDAGRLSVSETGAPLRTILNGWFGARRIPLIHAGAVGTEEGGVLVVGQGGVGKSTLSLAAALDGMLYAGDDYVLVESDPHPFVHSVYRTGKLDAHHLAASFPALHTRLYGSDWSVGQKRLFFVDEDAGGQISSGFPLRAVVVPTLNGEKTALRVVDAGLVIRTALPSTIIQLPGSGRRTFADLTALVRQVPCYVLELGPDSLQTAPQLLRELSAAR